MSVYRRNPAFGTRIDPLRHVVQRACGGLLLLLMLAPLAWSQPVGWSTALPITVTENSGAALNGYQLKLSVDTQSLITAGNMNADGSDLRFGADEQGNTLLNYWIESGINTASTTIWVRLGALPASSSVGIWMFTGNPGAVSASSLLGTFDFTSQYANSATNQVSGGGAGGVTNSQRGFRFSTSQDILVFQFGKNEPTGSTRYVTLFDFNTQAILTQTQVSGPAGLYNYADLPQPVWLTPGNQYLLEMYQGATDGYYFGAAPQMNPLLTYYDMRYCNGCTQNTFPTNSLGGMHYGYSDFEFVTHQQVSPAPTYAVGPGGTATGVISDNPAPTSGQAVTFTATVDGLFNPTGTVSFYDTDGVTPITGCTNPAPLDASDPPIAICNTTGLSAGPHSIYAVYSGDSNNLLSISAPLAQDVIAVSTTVLGSACLLEFVGGQPFTMDATVSGFNPTGEVTFTLDGNAVCSNVTLSGGAASCTVNNVDANPSSHTLSAMYTGDTGNTASASNTLQLDMLDPLDVLFRNNFEYLPPNCPIE